MESSAASRTGIWTGRSSSCPVHCPCSSACERATTRTPAKHRLCSSLLTPSEGSGGRRGSRCSRRSNRSGSPARLASTLARRRQASRSLRSHLRSFRHRSMGCENGGPSPEELAGRSNGRLSGRCYRWSSIPSAQRDETGRHQRHDGSGARLLTVEALAHFRRVRSTPDRSPATPTSVGISTPGGQAGAP